MNPSKGRTLLFFVALTGLGLAGNYFKYPVFFSIDFLFGSIFSMLALQLIGARLGVLSAFVVSSSTYFMWNHPYAVVIFTAEAIVVALLTSRRRFGLVNAAAVYWCVLGMPLVFLFYYYVMQLPLTNATVTMLKQAVNGIANALVARFIFFGFTYRSRQAEFAMREMMFNLLFLFVLVPSLIFIGIQSRQEREELDLRIRESLQLTAKRTATSLDDWVQGHIRRIAYLAELAARQSVPDMQRALEQLKEEEEDFLRVGLLDRNATIVAYSELVDELGKPNIGKNFADRPFIPQLKQTLAPMLSEVVIGRVGKPQPVVPLLAPVVSNGAYAGYVTGILNLAGVEKLLALNSQTVIWHQIDYALVDKNGKVISTNNEKMKIMQPFVRAKGDLIPLADGLSQWLPEMKRQISISDRWKDAVYIQESKIGKAAEWTLILELPVQPFQLKMYAEYTWVLLRLAIMLAVGLLLAALLSRRLVASLEDLKVITSDLPKRLSAKEGINWGQSAILEIQSLISNFSGMVKELARKFEQVEQFNAILEQEVATRTKELGSQTLRLRTILETASDGIHILDDEGNLVQYSQSFLFLLGYDNDAAARLNVRDWDAQIPQEELVEAVRDLIQQPATFESKHRRKDGTIIDVEISAKGIELDGRSYLYASARDITERKRAASVLQESEERFRNLANSAPVLVWMADTTKLCFWFNQRWLEFTGRSMDQEMGNGWAEAVHPEDLQRCLDTYVTAFDSRVPFSMDYRLRRHDGQYRWLIDQGVPRFDADGCFLGYIGSCIDITERKQTEEALRVHRIELELQNEELRRTQEELEAARARYFDLYDLAPVGYCSISKKGLILQANLTASTLLGTARGVLVEQPLSRFIQKEDHDVFYLNRKQIFESSLPKAFELRMVKHDGTPFWAHLAASAAHEADGASVLRVVLSDITEGKRAELELVAARNTADTANRAKSEFLSTMSHEIRTPLNGVIGNLQLLEMSALDREQTGYLSAISQSSSNLLSLINDILDLSKIEAEKVILEQMDFSLRGCINSVVLTQRSRIAQKGLSLKLDIPDEVPDVLVGDDLRVKQILINLLGNAIKFTGKGGITLSASVKERSGEIALIELSVGDTGIGISRAAIAGLFKPFVQADSSVARSFGGSGLGLAICKRLSRLMGGSISVESTEGVGSIFRVLLPFPVSDRVMPGTEVSEPASPALWTGPALNVLLAEDNQISLQFSVKLLNKMGHQVAVAENGKQALAALGREAFDIALMDIQMPVMNGDEALAVLRERERPSGKRLPVIALTAYALKGDKEKFLALGFDGYVSKPLEVKKLVAEMKRVLEVA